MIWTQFIDSRISLNRAYLNTFVNYQFIKLILDPFVNRLYVFGSFDYDHFR
jgi:hypothetical protein